MQKFTTAFLIISQDWSSIIVEGVSPIIWCLYNSAISSKAQGAYHCLRPGKGCSEIVYVAKKATAQDKEKINIERWAKSSPHCKSVLKSGSKQETRNIKVI